MPAETAKEGTLSALEQIKLIYLSYFSHPAGDRPVFKAIRKNRVRRIVECGIGTTQRSQRMIEAARLVSPGEDIHFTGIDLFEARGSADGPGVSIKLAHRRLCATGARVKLIPGGPPAFARAANTLGDTDMLVISSRQNLAALAEVWFFVPRILHTVSVVFEEVALIGGQTLLKAVDLEEVTRRTGGGGSAPRSRRAA